MKYLLLPFLISSALAAEKFVQTAPLSGDETDSQILEIASNVVPAPRQLEYHREEFIGFIHYGPNTYTSREWGSGMEDAKVFAPTDVDTDQWCRVMKDAGMSKIIITVKHHDGYCTWQTRYNTEFSVHQSPWMSGKGDVLRLLSQSCKKFGLKLGVYLSPADLFQMESKTGLYGNGSNPRASVIPTDPESFTSDPSAGRKHPEGKPEFRHELDDYNRYFMNQLYELLTEYGPIHEVWFDGAHPKHKGGQTYRKDLWYAMIRKLSPDTVIFGGPDVRWVGNERGDTRDDEWNVIPISSVADSGKDRPIIDLGTDAMLTARTYEVYKEKLPSDFLNYMVAEVDVSIRNGWFWRNNDEQKVRSADNIFDIYERCAGGNAVFLLNVPPARDGKMAAPDVACMAEVGRRIRATYGTDLAAGFSTKAKGIDSSDTDTFWQPDGTTGSFEVTLPEARTVNRIALQEAIGKVGQRVKSHAIDAWVDGAWKEISTAGVIGYKRIHRVADITASKFRVRILDSRNTPSVATFAAHYYVAPPQAVEISRSGEGKVFLKTESSSLPIRYTTDGSEPDAASALYEAPFALPAGGEIRARSIVGENSGPVAQATFGILPQGWKVSASSQQSDHEAAKAIDGDPASFWISSTEKEDPISLALELPATATIRGFTYTPRQDKRVPEGMVAEWKIESSSDGKTWQQIATAEFGNLLNDPSRRTHFFEKAQSIRWIRFTSLRGAEDSSFAGAAEIELLAK